MGGEFILDAFTEEGINLRVSGYKKAARSDYDHSLLSKTVSPELLKKDIKMNVEGKNEMEIALLKKEIEHVEVELRKEVENFHNALNLTSDLKDYTRDNLSKISTLEQRISRVENIFKFIFLGIGGTILTAIMAAIGFK